MRRLPGADVCVATVNHVASASATDKAPCCRVVSCTHGLPIPTANVVMSARAQIPATSDQGTWARSGTGRFERRELKRILIVDDEAHVLRVMRLSLDRNGYEVDTALDGEVGLRMLREQRYAAVIVSGEFAPDGYGLCESLRRQFGDDAPLMLVMVDDADTTNWSEVPADVERIDRPVSLRWIVARLNEYFGDYERR